MLRQSGVLKLPSQRTLRDYSHHTEATPGFSAEVDSMVMKAAEVESCSEREKCILLLLDEMHVREDLVYDKHSGDLIGFSNLGDINSHLDSFERAISSGSEAPQPVLAKTVMVFMVRGLFTKLQFAYAQFPCSQVRGDKLYVPFWEAVCRLEKCGFKVTLLCTLILVLMSVLFCTLILVLMSVLLCMLGAGSDTRWELSQPSPHQTARPNSQFGIQGSQPIHHGSQAITLLFRSTSPHENSPELYGIKSQITLGKFCIRLLCKYAV